ncbi:PepSY-like domain-containing protein [Bacteroides mediterraneensis]|uniref:PepSY-like domain-containing protein n=1 Tax=Bacteroides mediterraneensis TaxID=1841856 RepID=A0ABS2EUS1_9BACE|nr:PepSY-like domain-containing protein [Bacteroides mediterraneensis]MBM6758119.1 PepSY-like domain-containing protein [Bacteroides mediterraneensis]MBM6781495.1 PepSY-like domain-containing protein [Bacteroides mediterraneensis]
MKKFAFWAMMTLSVVSLTSCDKDDDHVRVSADLQAAFDSRYPNASRVDWERNGGFYEAEFVGNGYENKAWFTPDGAWVMTEYDIPFNQLPQAVLDAFAASAYATWRVDDVDMIEKSGMEMIYVIEVESGEREYELCYLEDGTLLRENTEWGDHLPVAPGQTADVKALVMEKYPQAVILDIEEDRRGIEVEIRDGGRQKEVLYQKDASGVLTWVYTMYEVSRYEMNNLPAGVQQALTDLSTSGMRVDDVDYFETADGNYYRIEVDKWGADKYIYVGENGETVQVNL